MTRSASSDPDARSWSSTTSGSPPSTPCRSDARERLREQFRTDIFPMITPLAMDPAHPFPFISNLALNLLVTLRYPRAAARPTWRASRYRSARMSASG
jgi:hypothetical protein